MMMMMMPMMMTMTMMAMMIINDDADGYVLTLARIPEILDVVTKTG